MPIIGVHFYCVFRVSCDDFLDLCGQHILLWVSFCELIVAREQSRQKRALCYSLPFRVAVLNWLKLPRGAELMEGVYIMKGNLKSDVQPQELGCPARALGRLKDPVATKSLHLGPLKALI